MFTCKYFVYVSRALLPGATRHLSSTSSNVPKLHERKEKVLDANINIIETVEHGKSAPAIFYLPGAFGSIEMDFKPIVHQFNRKKYKWISWDPPGYGKSVPPKREFLSKNFDGVNLLDIQYIKEIMKMQGHQKYTLLAWSGAALSAITIAAEQPEIVSGLITWGAFGFVSSSMLPGVKMMRDMGLAAIPEGRRAQLINMYGEEYLLEMWHGWCDEAARMSKTDLFKKGGTFQETMNKVECPVLIIQGLKDALITLEQAKHLNTNLKKSRLHIMENGTHNLHLRETKEFVKCIQDFVDESSS